jgi:membrane-associated protein
MLDIILWFVDFVLHLDVHLGALIQQYGLLVYAILFLIIFAETGLVFAPILPGDSLLFAAGAFAAIGSLDIFALFILLATAAIIGDTVNYWIGHYLGRELIRRKSRLVNKEYLDRTKKFYDKHGGITIVIARFVPIIRTFAPFLGGLGAMKYRKFILYNIIGGIAWVSLFLFAGFFFGNIPLVKDNFSVIIIAIIVISLVPAFFEFSRHLLASRRKRKK